MDTTRTARTTTGRWRAAGVALAAGLALAVAASPALGETVTASGQGQARVEVRGKPTQASIAAAVDRARNLAVPQAAAAAWLQATRYAAATGLSLTAIQTVAEPSVSFYGPFGGNYNRFGPTVFCGPVTSSKTRLVNGRRTVVSRRTVTRCFVPSYVAVGLELTYSAVPAPPPTQP